MTRRSMVRGRGFAVVVALGTAALLAGPALIASAATLQVDNPRHSPGQIAASSAYDYAPSSMVDGGYRMWWCGQDARGRVPGDDILYGVSDSPDGPFQVGGATQIVFEGTGLAGTFDEVHACDPSVVRVNGTYYMYYGGLGNGDPNDITKIGVATSPDGVAWTRLNNGAPIIEPANPDHPDHHYGAGQPSAIYLAGMFYLMFTDDTAPGALPNGAGQFVYRSADPLFANDVEVFTENGWQPRTADNDRTHHVVNGFSVDWQYVDALDSFVVASHSAAGQTMLHFLDHEDLDVHPYDDVAFAGDWSEGPGIVSRPDKHAVPSTNAECGRVPIDVMHASTDNGTPQQLVHKGVDVFTGADCDAYTPKQVAAIYESWGVQADGLPAMVVVAGRRLQVESFDLYTRLARHQVDVPPSLYERIPFGGEVHIGERVLGAPERPAAFLLDGALWPVDSGELITANGSEISMVDTEEWDSYPTGQSLHLVR